MVQEIITYLILAFSFGLTFYKIILFFNFKKKNASSSCGSCSSGACGSCSLAKQTDIKPQAPFKVLHNSHS